MRKKVLNAQEAPLGFAGGAFDVYRGMMRLRVVIFDRQNNRVCTTVSEISPCYGGNTAFDLRRVGGE